jgi:hypothetical protein
MLSKHQGQVNILSIKSTDPRVELDVVELKHGSLYRLTATCPGDLSELDPSACVIIETDDPDQPELTIPIKKL